MTAPAKIGNGNPRLLPIPINARPIVPEVPQLLPVAKEAIAQIISVEGKKISADKVCRP